MEGTRGADAPMPPERKNTDAIVEEENLQGRSCDAVKPAQGYPSSEATLSRAAPVLKDPALAMTSPDVPAPSPPEVADPPMSSMTTQGLRERAKSTMSCYSIDYDAEDLERGISSNPPLLSMPSTASQERISVGCCCARRAGVSCVEEAVAMTPQEATAFKRLSKMASIQLDEENPRHDEAMKQYWALMLGNDVPYEARSPRWSDDLGFQSKSPWTDFRGGGLLALRCLVYLAEHHPEQAKQYMEEAKWAQNQAWYPFSVAGVTLCQMLAVHLRLHARPAVGPIRKLPRAHALALKRFVRHLLEEDPVTVFARFWMAALGKLHNEWRDLCKRDPRANVLVSFNQVYRYVGVALESTFAWKSGDRLTLLADVNPMSKRTQTRNFVSRFGSHFLVTLLQMEGFVCCRRRRDIPLVPQDPPAQDNDPIKPPEMLTSNEIYKLYRGATGSVEGQIGKCRIWVDFTTLELCLAFRDLPATANNRVPLMGVTWCSCASLEADFQVDIYEKRTIPQRVAKLEEPVRGKDTPTVSISGANSLKEFAEALTQLLQSRDTEGPGVLKFIQRRLSQYLWRNQRVALSAEALYEAQAVIDFNLKPKDGIKYLCSKLSKSTDDEIGEWLAEVCREKGGLDASMLGEYFSKKDTIPIFWAFVRRIDFRGLDILGALRQLFDTFKPGGEGQVITRILESFSESYFQQWKKEAEITEPQTAYKDADSVLQVAVSLIMLNTGVHIAPQKTKKGCAGVAMSVEQYISNTRLVVPEEEVPDAALTKWYDEVSQQQISVEPMPRQPFSKLPVQPDVEGWLIIILEPMMQVRYWAVLVLGRLYLFTDTSGEADPEDIIDLKDVTVQHVKGNDSARKRFEADLLGSRCLPCCGGRAQHSEFVQELLSAEDRALEIRQISSGGSPSLLKNSVKRPRSRLSLVAESMDLAEKWTNLAMQQ
eukprot:TRINITY_DN19860_c0_g1_i3.p1 TRINITY_DN19860_c0_g1~~TRINITY_DN19860_c0_g1_i3.p1  ORF type:complete len:936 (-),score=220.48 TRINITY_DN19860_c0_g1_i3:76-2883(-)